MKETEYNYILKKGEFDYIHSCIKLSTENFMVKHITQTHYYYDTEDYTLDKAGVSCYVLDDGCGLKGAVKLCGKIPETEDIEIPIEADGVSECINLGAFRLKLLGSFHTDREVCKISEGVEIMFDIDSYLGEREYGISLEFTDRGRGEARKLLRDIELLIKQYRAMTGENNFDGYVKTAAPKSSRFIIKKRSMRGLLKYQDMGIGS